MTALVLGVALLTLALAAANGANDVAKGVATLAGAGVARYRTAVLWGGATTFAGALVSFVFAERLTALFSRGIVAAPPTPPFALAVLAGAKAWVGLATATRLPVSTTHALVGALVGAGVQLGPGAVDWTVLLTGVALPLLSSVAVAYLVSALLAAVPPTVPECVCVDLARAVPGPIVVGPTAATVAPDRLLPVVGVTTGSSAACRAHGLAAAGLRLTMTVAH